MKVYIYQRGYGDEIKKVVYDQEPEDYELLLNERGKWELTSVLDTEMRRETQIEAGMRGPAGRKGRS